MIQFIFMRTIFLFLIATFPLLNVNAQQNSNLLSNDPQLLKGKLENGITYYIRENKKPEKKSLEIRNQKGQAIIQG